MIRFAGSGAAEATGVRATTCTTMATARALSTARRTTGNVNQLEMLRSEPTQRAPRVTESAAHNARRTISDRHTQAQISQASVVSR